MGQTGHSNFSISHGSRRITIHRSKVSLPIHQHITQRKRLGHTYYSIINSCITMWVVFTYNIPHHTGGFFIGFIAVNIIGLSVIKQRFKSTLMKELEYYCISLDKFESEVIAYKANGMSVSPRLENLISII